MDLDVGVPALAAFADEADKSGDAAATDTIEQAKAPWFLREAMSEAQKPEGGSISAEHGLGRLERDAITHYKPAIEIDLMRTLKRMLDPGNMLIPDKVVAAQTAR